MKALHCICLILFGFLLSTSYSKASTEESSLYIAKVQLDIDNSSLSYADHHSPLKFPQKQEDDSEKEESERELSEKENKRKESQPEFCSNLFTQQFAIEQIIHTSLHFQELKNTSFSTSQICILYQVWLI